MNAKYPPIGTVSHATMRTEDLIPAFMDVLRVFAPERHAELEQEQPEELEDGDYPDVETASEWLNDVLWTAMEEIAPPYCYFGASEGDGADYGFWPSIESLEEDARYKEGVIKVADTSEVPDDWRDYVMHVSDHGNVTLYEIVDSGNLEEIWSVV